MTIQELANETAELSAKLETLRKERATIEGQVIAKLIAETRHGLKYDKIKSEWTNWTRNHAATQSFFADGRRGLLLYSVRDDGHTPNDLTISITVDQDDAYLMSDGSIHLYRWQATVSRYELAVDEHTREFVREMKYSELDAEEVAAAIREALEKRLANLGERTKAQRDRIAKVSAMMNAGGK